ncbi:nuclear transport factor 2 family protein [Mycolicibacterium sp.]|uniref:nuclear transport factor 2 family protein n=1 Tax=Mycolicibacterium sp. TaxID=2320850 RepID=UPI001A32F9AC|nr:nuclear transport factor 2 family protein [Mycolicibacterium sp.]MBJ7338218.1 nuclear transport factor 2 family protein [Mycolicibacterium sp.]
MATLNEREQRALESYRAYVAQRERCVAGEAAWSTIGQWFTDDAVFIDPAWGRVQGREEIARFFDHSMNGFEGWSFPEEWTMVDGDRLVTFWWNRVPGTREDGAPYQAPAFSLLHYAGDGLFDYELDLMNITEVGELLAASGWLPGADMTFPGPHPDRNVTPPRLTSP